MFTLEKTIDYITIPAILLNKEKEIIESNSHFKHLFSIKDDFSINGLHINSDIFKENTKNPFILDFINDNIDNIHEKYLTFHDENKKYIRINSLVFKNGTTNYMLVFENISKTFNLSYLYQEILNNTNMGVVICNNINGDFIIKDVNHSYCKLFNITKDDVLNTNIKNFICNNNKLFDTLRHVLDTGKKKMLKKINCANKWLNVVIIKTETDDIIVMVEDVTLETSALEKLEKSDKYKTEFLSNMSHEIRSPLNSIIGFSELLKEVNDDKEKIEQYINIIQKSSESLTKIINDILDISKIEEGKLEINKTNFNLNSFLEELYMVNKTKMKNEKVNFILNIPKNDTTILCDSFRLRQVINNLINNANKFTDSGFIELGYTKKSNFIEFYVKDSGIGIKIDEQNKIFERYSQSAYNNKKTLGHGLGLSISKELISLMGGTIRLESEYGKGSTFIFNIPNNKSIKRFKNLNNNQEIIDVDFSGKKIMIVEDIDFNIKLLESYLENTNAELIVATDGNDAILKYNKHKNNLDIILMDIQLPEINGTDVTRMIRNIDKDTPIIAQTAYAMRDDIDNIMEFGFNDLIHKPIKKEELLKIIYKYIN